MLNLCLGFPLASHIYYLLVLEPLFYLLYLGGFEMGESIGIKGFTRRYQWEKRQHPPRNLPRPGYGFEICCFTLVSSLAMLQKFMKLKG